MKSTDEPIVVTQSFSVTRARVWQAITLPSEMRDWFFEEIPDFQPSVGFDTQFAISFEEKTYTHVWKVLEVVAEERMVCDWSYKGLPGRGVVTWELAFADDATVLTLTSKATESFPQDDPAFHRESAMEGWKYLIQEQLVDHLQNASA